MRERIGIDLTFGRLSFEQTAIENSEIHDIGGLRVRLPPFGSGSASLPLPRVGDHLNADHSGFDVVRDSGNVGALR
jgi:hypothetical protein